MNRFLLSVLPLFSFVFLLSGCRTSASGTSLTVKQKQLILAIREDSLPRTKAILKAGTSPDTCDEGSVPVILIASLSQSPDCLDALLKAGANPNAVDDESFTPLHCAAAAGRYKNLQILIKAGSNVNAKTRNGRSPLMEAVRMGHLECAKLLVQSGADLKAIDNDGGTLATHAATAPKNGEAVLRYMYMHKIPFFYQKGNLVNSPLIRALYYGKRENAKFILSTIPSFEADEMQPLGQFAIRFAIRDNNFEAVKTLVAKKVQLNTTTSLIFKATQIASVEGVYKLSARENIIDRGYTPLMWAAIYGRPDIAEYLIRNGSDPYCISNEGQTADVYAHDTPTAQAIKNATREWNKINKR